MDRNLEKKVKAEVKVKYEVTGWRSKGIVQS
jgi:hypothetical protein